MCRVARAKGTLSVRVGEFPMTVPYEQKNIVVGCPFGNVLKSVCDGGILQKIARVFRKWTVLARLAQASQASHSHVWVGV